MSSPRPGRERVGEEESGQSPDPGGSFEAELVVAEAGKHGQLLRLLEEALDGTGFYGHEAAGEPMPPAVREAIRAYRAHVAMSSQGGDASMDATEDRTATPPRLRLEREWRAYQAYLRSDARREGDRGAFVLIVGDQVVGIFATRDDALDRGYAEVGHRPFLVHRILDDEPILDLPPYVA